MNKFGKRRPKETTLDKRHHAAFPMAVPQYICPNESCEATIPPTHVVAGLIGDRADMETVRMVRVRCPHCMAAWEASQILECGFWHCTSIDPIDDLAAVARLQHQIDLRLGVIQRTAAAA